jgi:hypothetical protein
MKLITMVFYLISPALADPEVPEIPPPTYTEGSKHVWVGGELSEEGRMEGIWFRTTNSPCRDAVLANLNLNRCTGLQTVQDTQGIFEYTCNTPDVRSDVPWTTWTFVEIDRPLIEMGVVSPAAPVPLCVDVWIYLYAINPADSE